MNQEENEVINNNSELVVEDPVVEDPVVEDPVVEEESVEVSSNDKFANVPSKTSLQETFCEVDGVSATLITYAGGAMDLCCDKCEQHDFIIEQATELLAQRGLVVGPPDIETETSVTYSIQPI